MKYMNQIKKDSKSILLALVFAIIFVAALGA